MSEKVQKRSPGRPRAYDPERALDAAMRAFWRAGFAGTSLDDLTASTAMNRPSLYGAFGDKQALYLKTIDRYRDAASAALTAELAVDRPLPESLRIIYRRALDTYQAGHATPRGCYLTSTAVSAALEDPEVRAALWASHQAFDRVLAARFASARETGEVTTDLDPSTLGSLATGVFHTLAIRARAGETRKRLEQIADAAVVMLCGPRPRKRVRRGRS